MSAKKKKKGKKNSGGKKPGSGNVNVIAGMVSNAGEMKSPKKEVTSEDPAPPPIGELPGPGQGPTNAGHYFYASEDYGLKLPGISFPHLLGRHADQFSKKLPINGIPYEAYFNPVFGKKKKKKEAPSLSLNTFWLETTYPGLLIGTGYLHPAIRKGDDCGDSDFQSGFFFDWTTGAPVIPGSTVKGALRAVFPRKEDREDIREGKLDYILERLRKFFPAETGPPSDPAKFVDELEKELFAEGKTVFMDAFVAGVPDGQKVFAEDYITPHRHGPFQDPIPLRFLKIGPGVQFQFLFRLREITLEGVTLKGGNLKAFFQNILIDFGIGAKRNVGYGALVDPNPKKG